LSLRVEHVRLAFGAVQAVSDVWFETPKGAVMGVIGPNGAGKTTTMRLILHILDPNGGHITWNGRPVAQWPVGSFGYLPEERGLYPQMTGRDELRFFAQLHGMNARAAEAEIAYWCEQLQLADVLNKKVDELSKGNAQKLQFLAAVLHRPQLVILDEPFSGLDPVNARLFKGAIKQLSQMGSTILFSSHQMENVEELCDYVCLIAGGRTLELGSVAEVRRLNGIQVLTLKTDEHTISQAHPLPGVAGVAGVSLMDGGSGEWRYQLQVGADVDSLLRLLAQRGGIRHFSVDYPSLEDVYIARVSQFADQQEEALMARSKSI